MIINFKVYLLFVSTANPIHGNELELKAGENLVKEKKGLLVLQRERHSNLIPAKVKESTFVRSF